MSTYSKIILTNSRELNAVPFPENLDYGELAINYNDGKLFFKNEQDVVKVIADIESVEQTVNHINNRNNPHRVTKSDVGLGNVENYSAAQMPLSEAATTALDTKASLVQFNALQTLVDQNTSDINDVITIDNIVVENNNVDETQFPQGGLKYEVINNPISGLDEGVLKYYIPQLELMGAVGTDAFSVVAPTVRNNDGTLKYIIDQTGLNTAKFEYDKPTLEGLGGVGLGDFRVVENAPSLTPSLSYTPVSGEGIFTYTPPDLSSLEDLSNNQGTTITNVNRLIELTGVPTNSTTLGIYSDFGATSPVILQNANIKQTFQSVNDNLIDIYQSIESLNTNTGGNGTINLDTTSNTLSGAINELHGEIEDIYSYIGTPISNLQTTDKSSLVAAINEIETSKAEQSDVGTLTSLDTSDKTSLVAAINEVHGDAAANAGNVGTLTTDVGTLTTDVGTLTTDVGTLTTDVGTLTSLVTSDKTNLVNAINEVHGDVASHTHSISDITDFTPGSIATQNSDSVSITGGTITGVSIEASTVVSAQQLGFKNTPANAVTQITDINTPVTINSPAGTITCVGHVFSSNTPETFTVSNNTVDETDVIILSFKNGVASIDHKVTRVDNNEFDISLFDYHNQSVDTTLSPLEINFAVIKHDIT